MTKKVKSERKIVSFDELRQEFGLKPIKYQTSDPKKLAQQRKRWTEKHVCPGCNQEMKFMNDTNVFTCSNPRCKGVKRERVNEETGEKEVYYVKSYHLLDDDSSRIANNIFAQFN